MPKRKNRRNVALLAFAAVAGWMSGSSWPMSTSSIVSVSEREASTILGGGIQPVPTCNIKGLPKQCGATTICDACGGTITFTGYTATIGTEVGSKKETANCGTGCTESYFAVCDTAE